MDWVHQWLAADSELRELLSATGGLPVRNINQGRAASSQEQEVILSSPHAHGRFLELHREKALQRSAKHLKKMETCFK